MEINVTLWLETLAMKATSIFFFFFFFKKHPAQLHFNFISVSRAFMTLVFVIVFTKKMEFKSFLFVYNVMWESYKVLKDSHENCSILLP